MSEPNGVRYVFEIETNGLGTLTITDSDGVRVFECSAAFDLAQNGEFKLFGVLDMAPVNNPTK